MKKGPEVSPAPSSSSDRSARTRLEAQLQAQLHCAGAARAELRVGAIGVGRKVRGAEWRTTGGITDTATGATAGIREVGMVENVEDFNADLGLKPLFDCEKLAH